MENEMKIRFGIDAIEEQNFKLSDSIPDGIRAEELKLRYLIETEILRSEEKVKMSVGVLYAREEKPVCELIVDTVYTLMPFSDIVDIDESQKTVSFKSEVLQTLLGASFGILRGVLFEKTKCTPLAAFPLPLIPMPALVEMNRFRVSPS